MIRARRGGYCFEQNMLFRAGLRTIGFAITSLQARVVGGLAIDAQRPALHMVLRVDLPEGPFLADVGFGNLAPTAPLLLDPMREQDTPHERMRFIPMGDELVLQSRLGERWEHIYRVVPYARFDGDYDIANWYTGTHTDSPYRANVIAARPGPDRTRLTLFNTRFTVRHADGRAERRQLDTDEDFRTVLDDRFGVELPNADLATALSNMRTRAAAGPPHPFFA